MSRISSKIILTNYHIDLNLIWKCINNNYGTIISSLVSLGTLSTYRYNPVRWHVAFSNSSVTFSWCHRCINTMHWRWFGQIHPRRLRLHHLESSARIHRLWYRAGRWWRHLHDTCSNKRSFCWLFRHPWRQLSGRTKPSSSLLGFVHPYCPWR